MLRALDFRERTKVRRFVYAKPTILLMVVLSVLSLRGAWNMYEKSKEAKANRDKAVAEMTALAAREAELKSDITDLSSSRGQEEEIRNRFMVAKDGEKVIIIARPDDADTHSVMVEDTEGTANVIDRLKAAVGLSGN
jgi:cell division protein FtsB